MLPGVGLTIASLWANVTERLQRCGPATLIKRLPQRLRYTQGRDPRRATSRKPDALIAKDAARVCVQGRIAGDGLAHQRQEVVTTTHLGA